MDSRTDSGEFMRSPGVISTAEHGNGISTIAFLTCSPRARSPRAWDLSAPGIRSGRPELGLFFRGHREGVRS